MTYSIFDSGNLVVSFEGEDEAFAALERLADEGPEVRDELLLAVFDDAGNMVDDFTPGSRVAHAV